MKNLILILIALLCAPPAMAGPGGQPISAGPGISGGGGTGGGGVGNSSDGQVTYNNGGVIDGIPSFLINDTTGILTVNGVDLPDNEGTNGHKLKGNEGTPFECFTNGAVTDGDITLFTEDGNNELKICDETATSESDTRTVATFSKPGASRFIVAGSEAAQVVLEVMGETGQTANILNVLDFTSGMLFSVNPDGDTAAAGILEGDSLKNGDNSFEASASGRVRANQYQVLELSTSLATARFQDIARVAGDDYAFEIGQLTNGATSGTIGAGVRIVGEPNGAVDIYTNQDNTAATGLGICDGDNSACGRFVAPAAMSSDQVYDLPERSGEMALAHEVVIESSASNHALTADEMFGKTHFCTTAAAGGCNYTLPVLVPGMRACFGEVEDGIINIDLVNGTDTIVLGGDGECSGGISVDSPGNQGSYACITVITSSRAFLSETQGNWTCGS